MSRDFLLQAFFHESPSPKPVKITLGYFFYFYRKFAAIFTSQRYQPNQCQFATSVNNTSGKFATSTAYVVDIGGKLPPVSTTLAVNLPAVLSTPVANNGNIIRLLNVNLNKNISTC